LEFGYNTGVLCNLQRGGSRIEYIRIMRDLREDADKTQQQIADYLGTSQTMYARYERGANELPLHHLIKLCQYYNVSADYFLGLDKKQSQVISQL